MTDRTYTPFDQLLGGLDQALRTVFGPPPEAQRPNPAAAISETDLDAAQRELAARLMRINHAGEICAQALYQGQALTAQLPNVRDKMEQAAAEENDHLAWTAERLRELGSHTSYLNSLWYAGSFAIGATAGLAGDKWSLGFVAETERQVVKHLDGHLEQLAPSDKKSRAILKQMREDEAGTLRSRSNPAAPPCPSPIRQTMRLMSKVMTTTAYFI